MASGFLILLLFTFTSSFAFASDHSPLQDFCVANSKHPGFSPNVVGLIPNSPVLVNGLACMDPKLAQADDFYFGGLDNPGNTSNTLGSSITLISVAQVPGLNTFGLSMARIDYAPWGLNPPHIHPRASEILTVLEGTLFVGFVTSNPENRLITKVLQKGDVFVFPVGLVHFERNVGYGNAVAIVGLSSQNPGVIAIASTVFGSDPLISDEVLAHAFQVDKGVVDYLQTKF